MTLASTLPGSEPPPETGRPTQPITADASTARQTLTTAPTPVPREGIPRVAISDSARARRHGAQGKSRCPHQPAGHAARPLPGTRQPARLSRPALTTTSAQDTCYVANARHPDPRRNPDGSFAA